MAKISDIQAKRKTCYESTTIDDKVTVEIKGNLIVVTVVNRDMRAVGKTPNPLNRGMNFTLELPVEKNIDLPNFLEKANASLEQLFADADEYRLPPFLAMENIDLTASMEQLTGHKYSTEEISMIKEREKKKAAKDPFIQLDDQLRKILRDKGYCWQSPEKKFGEILIEKGIITQTQLEEALGRQKKDLSSEKIGEILVRLGHIAKNHILEALIAQNPEKDTNLI